MFIFTPKIIGNYQIKLEIEDISEGIMAKEIFYFRAIPETTEVAIAHYKQITPTTSPPTIKKQYKNRHLTDMANSLANCLVSNNFFLC